MLRVENTDTQWRWCCGKVVMAGGWVGGLATEGIDDWPDSTSRVCWEFRAARGLPYEVPRRDHIFRQPLKHGNMCVDLENGFDGEKGWWFVVVMVGPG